MNRICTIGAGLYLVVSATAAQANPERFEDGKKAYQAICAECHEQGVDGAPVTGNSEDWQQRSGLWEAVLLEHAEKGYFGMPAKGGSDYATEYDVGVAAEYMLTITHPQLPRD